MSIEFETPKPIAQQQYVLKTVAEEMMRSVSRQLDEEEHLIPYSYIEFMHAAMRATGAGALAPKEKGNGHEDAEKKEKRPPIGYQLLAHMMEMLSWGDVGMYLVTPGGGLGAAAVDAAATPEQKKKFLARFGEEKPTFAAMCMTEPGAGSDTSAIKTTAVLDEKPNEWVINGEKIFVTAGHKSMVADEQFGKGFIISAQGTQGDTFPVITISIVSIQFQGAVKIIHGFLKATSKIITYTHLPVTFSMQGIFAQPVSGDS